MISAHIVNLALKLTISCAISTSSSKNFLLHKESWHCIKIFYDYIPKIFYLWVGSQLPYLAQNSSIAACSFSNRSSADSLQKQKLRVTNCRNVKPFQNPNDDNTYININIYTTQVLKYLYRYNHKAKEKKRTNKLLLGSVFTNVTS